MGVTSYYIYSNLKSPSTPHQLTSLAAASVWLDFCLMATVHRGLRSGPALEDKIKASLQALKEHSMNTIIYIVGLVVVIGFLLSFFGFR